MASTFPGDDSIIFSGQCLIRDHIRVVGFPALHSRLSDRVDLASVCFALRINSYLKRSEDKNGLSKITQKGGKARRHTHQDYPK